MLIIHYESMSQSQNKCYYCYALENNPYAIDHISENCMDKGNKDSKVPLEKRTIDTTKFERCKECNIAINMATGCRKCEGLGIFDHCWSHHK